MPIPSPENRSAPSLSISEGRPLAVGALSSSTPAPGAQVQIGPGDLVDLTVFDTPELSGKARVDPSGSIDLILGGKVYISGLSPAQASRAVEKQFRDASILRNPHVSLNVLESTQGVTVLGEVKNPGSYPLWGQQRVVDLISAAGGLTQYASHMATLTRKGSGAPLVISISLNDSFAQAATKEATVLPGDRIVVPRAGTIYVLGDVGKPGGFMVDNQNSMTVLQGLALAQGLNRTASLHGSLIRQTAEGPRQELLDLKKILGNQLPDPPLRNGDIVYVPLNSVKDWANRGMNTILQMSVGAVIYGRYY